MEMEEIKQQKFTIIGADNYLTGEFHFTGHINIAAVMEGTLIVKDGEIILGSQADYKGSIECQDIEIFGKFKGTLKARNKVIIRSSAQVEGEIEASSMAVYPGAKLDLEGHTQQEQGL
ncbi:MAG: bactofilin family protein [Bacteriovoracia bacterium]